MRVATDADRQVAALNLPIPLDVVNPSALVAMQEWLAAEAVEVDELTLGRALTYYFDRTAA